MYSLREFLKIGLLDAVGKKPLYWITSNAAGWMEKGILQETDLEEIYNKIERLNKPKEN